MRLERAARHGELRLLTIGMAVFNFVYNIAYSTLVHFARERLQVTETGFGFLLAASAVGGLVAGYLVPKLHFRPSAQAIYGAGLASQGVGWLLVLVAPNAWLGGVALSLVGAASMSVTVLGGTARQRLTPDDLMGRVSATTRVAGIGVAALWALMGGVVANTAGLSAPLAVSAIIAGSATIVLMAVVRP